MLYSHLHHPLSSRYDCGFDSFCFHLLIKHLFSQFAGSYMDAGVGTAWSNLGLRNLDWLLRTQARPLQIPKLFQPEIALWTACWCWFGRVFSAHLTVVVYCLGKGTTELAFGLVYTGLVGNVAVAVVTSSSSNVILWSSWRGVTIQWLLLRS